MMASVTASGTAANIHSVDWSGLSLVALIQPSMEARTMNTIPGNIININIINLSIFEDNITEK